MESAALQFEQINPFVRYVHSFTIEQDTIFVDVVPYDCRCIYITGGHGAMRLQGRTYPAAAGSLFLWPAGVAYSYLPEPDHPFSVLGVNFDYTLARSDVRVPVPPSAAADFQAAGLLAPVHFTDLSAFHSVVALQGMYWMQETLQEMEQEYLTRRNHYVSRLRGLFLALLCDVARCVRNSGETRCADAPVDAMLGYLHAHFREPLSNEELGRIFSFHPAYISRIIKRHTGVALHRYLLRYRLTVALNLLQTTSLPIGQIALNTGFADSNYFSRCFKKQWGKSPGSFRV